MLQRSLKSAIGIISLLSFLCFLPAGLLISGYISLALANKLELKFFATSPYMEIFWIITNIVIGFISFKNCRIQNWEFFFENRFRFPQIIYLVFGMIYYSEPFGSTQTLNRYIFLFLFMLLSVVIESVLHYTTRLKAKRVFNLE